MSKKRTVGFTLLSLALWWLAIAGLVGAFIFPGGLPIRAVFVAYGFTALIAGTGLWRQASWAAFAFAIWSCTVLAIGVIADVQLNLGPSSIGAAFIAVCTGLLWLAYRYIRKGCSLAALSV